MSKALYDIYQQSVFDLVKTLVFKSSAVADAFNKTLTKNRWPDPGTDQSTWRYYMNLAGEYHEYDEKYLINEAIPGRMVIKVASITGPVDAAFTRELIENDAVIANEYRFGSPYYNALVARYPVCVDLIHGILNPVEKNVAISAVEGEILYAGGFFKTIQNDRRLFVARILPGRKPPNYIEENEDNLLPQLESFIQRVLSRWTNQDFYRNNDLFVTSQLSILYMNLPGKILNIRLNNCFTPMVHSYHIREYLESNGKLIRYVDAIPKEQLHWLYRNLRYLERNVGKEETFQLLVDKLITPLNMPLMGYDLKHNLANQDAVTPANDYPESVMFRRQLSKGGIQLGDSNRSIDRVMRAQIGLARDNGWNLDQKSTKVDGLMTYRSKSAILPTKILESSVTDDSQSIVYPLANVLYSLWAYMASRDEYVASVYVTHPITGERSLLSPKQCLIVYVYLVTRDWDSPPDEIPALYLHNIPRPVTSIDPEVPAKPTLAFLKNQIGKNLQPGVIEAIFGGNTSLGTPSTVGGFYDVAYGVYEELMRRYDIYVRIQELTERSVADNVADSLYFRAKVRPAEEGTLFTAWMEENGVDLSALTAEQRNVMAHDILIAVTGADDETANLKLRQRQEAIINAMRYLSSYAIQYMTEITGSRSFPGGWGPLRLGNIVEKSLSLYKFDLGKVTGLTTTQNEKTTFEELIEFESVDADFEPRERQDVELTFGTFTSTDSVDHQTYNLPTSRFTILEVSTPADPLSLVAPDNVLDGFKYPDN